MGVEGSHFYWMVLDDQFGETWHHSFAALQTQIQPDLDLAVLSAVRTFLWELRDVRSGDVTGITAPQISSSSFSDASEAELSALLQLVEQYIRHSIKHGLTDVTDVVMDAYRDVKRAEGEHGQNP